MPPSTAGGLSDAEYFVPCGHRAESAVGSQEQGPGKAGLEGGRVAIR